MANLVDECRTVADGVGSALADSPQALESVLTAASSTLTRAAGEIKRVKSELSWIYANCELRDGDGTHVNSDDVQAAVAAEAAGRKDD